MTACSKQYCVVCEVKMWCCLNGVGLPGYGYHYHHPHPNNRYSLRQKCNRVEIGSIFLLQMITQWKLRSRNQYARLQFVVRLNGERVVELIGREMRGMREEIKWTR